MIKCVLDVNPYKMPMSPLLMAALDVIITRAFDKVINSYKPGLQSVDQAESGSDNHQNTKLVNDQIVINKKEKSGSLLDDNEVLELLANSAPLSHNVKQLTPIKEHAAVDYFVSSHDRHIDVPSATADFTYSRESRLHQSGPLKGKLKVYRLGKKDGGGSHEIAGINARYHPEKCRELEKLLQEHKFDEAEKSAKQYYQQYSNQAVKWIPQLLREYHFGDNAGYQLDAIEGVMRDVAFNRGNGGAIIRFQKALNKTIGTKLKADGGMGPKSRQAVADLLSKLPPQKYEDDQDYWVKILLENYRNVISDMETDRPEFEKGLNNRFEAQKLWGLKILHDNNPVTH